MPRAPSASGAVTADDSIVLWLPKEQRAPPDALKAMRKPSSYLTRPRAPGSARIICTDTHPGEAASVR